MKNLLPKIKQFFSNKKVIIVLLILAVSTIIFEVKQIFFTNHQPKVVYYTPAVNRPNYFETPTPAPTSVENTDEFSVVEKNGEYIVSNPYTTYFDKLGNIFYVKRIESIPNNPDEDEYILLKYNLDTKKSEEIIDNNVSGKIHSMSISNSGIVYKENNHGLDVNNELIYCNELKGGRESKNTGLYTFLYKIENSNVNFIDKMDCKYPGYMSGVSSLIQTKGGKNIVVTGGGDSCASHHGFWVKDKKTNEFEGYYGTQEGCVSSGSYSYLGYISDLNSINLAKNESNEEKGEYFQSKILIMDLDSMVEKEIITLGQKAEITNYRTFKFGDNNYLYVTINWNKIIIYNLNNNEKIFEKDLGNDISMGNFVRILDDKITFKINNDTFQCFNLSAKEFVSLDACGDPNKIYLGQWNGKNIYQINSQQN